MSSTGAGGFRMNSDTVIPSVPEGDFSVDEWRRFRDALRVAEPIFRKVATELDLRLLSSARWPELRLQRHDTWTTGELRLALHPGSTVESQGESQWVINFVRYPRYAWIPVGGSSAETIKLLSADELGSAELLKDIRGAGRRLLPGVKR